MTGQLQQQVDQQEAAVQAAVAPSLQKAQEEHQAVIDKLEKTMNMWRQQAGNNPWLQSFSEEKKAPFWVNIDTNETVFVEPEQLGGKGKGANEQRSSILDKQVASLKKDVEEYKRKNAEMEEKMKKSQVCVAKCLIYTLDKITNSYTRCITFLTFLGRRE